MRHIARSFARAGLLALLLGPAAARAAEGGCPPMMARWQGHEAELSALDPADLDAYNVAQNAIDRAAHLCEAGQDAEAARIMDASRRPPPRLR